MMDISPGMPCQSSNFLRALRTILEALALGLIFTDQAAVWKCNVPRLVQSWNRFILQQIHMQTLQSSSTRGGSVGLDQSSNGKDFLKNAKVTMDNPETMSKEISEAFDHPRTADESETDYGADTTESLFCTLFGMSQEKVNVCTRCKDSKAKKDTILLCNLAYPDSSNPVTAPPTSTASTTASTAAPKEKEDRCRFEDIVCSSLCPEVTTPAWCEQCKKYQTTKTRQS